MDHAVFSNRRGSLSVPSTIALLLLLSLSAMAQPAVSTPMSLPPLRIPNLAIGTRCFGFLPCTWIDPFGLRLRAAVLAVFRPEKGHDRDFYAARIQIAPAVTLMQWAEIGVAIPITLYKKDIGVSPVYEPLEPYGRVRIPLDDVLGGVAVTASVRVHISSGPFAGGLPPRPAGDTDGSSRTPNLTGQAVQIYRQQSQVEFALASSKRIGPVTATGSLGTSVAVGRAEIYGGGELAYHFKIFHAFLQAQGMGVPVCPPEEAALQFCARAFRFGAGMRFDWDLGEGGMMLGTASGGAEGGWMVGVQIGLDYDETTRRRHGDGIEAAHKWWQRRFEAMARGWAAWKSAAAVWDDAQEAARRARPPRLGPFSDLLGGASPPPSSPWLDALLDAPLSESFLPSDAEVGAHPPAGGGKLPASHPKGQPRRKPPRRSLFAEANAHAALQRNLARAQHFALPGSLDLMTDEELSHQHWQVMQEELRRAEQQQWHDASQLPPMEKVLLNFLATAPYEASLFFLEISGPGAAAEVEQMRQRLRPLKYTPAEQEAGAAMEGAYRSMSMALGPAAAEQAMARQALLTAARADARAAGHVAEFAAAEESALGSAAKQGAVSAKQSGPRFAGILERLPPRWNPLNYECCGLGSNFGNIRFRAPRPSPSPVGTVESLAEHEAPNAVRPHANELEAQSAAEAKAGGGATSGSRPFLRFTKSGKEEVWSHNAAKNQGTNNCDLCGVEVIKPQKHTKGVTPPSHEGQVDHVTARSKGGSGTPENGQLLCRDCNLEKSDR